MRAVLQRVSRGSVAVDSKNYKTEIGKGAVVLLGISEKDTEEEAEYLAEKCCNLRIFEDEFGKMNLSLKDIKGEALVISQFTLYGDTRKGNRPSFNSAAKPTHAIPLYYIFLNRMKETLGRESIKEGIFGEMMQVEIINEGPVTVLVESK